MLHRWTVCPRCIQVF
uniref:Uncharacterized protein n=1 Tax=Anguilla anguilla TaxID=7936 RepID=A0A0E9SG74_ANGAN